MRSRIYFNRDYRHARRHYGLGAKEAFQYAQQRHRLGVAEWDERIEHGVQGTEDGFLMVLFRLGWEAEILTSMGIGDDNDIEVDERGWIDIDRWDPYYVALADSLLTEYREAEAAAA